MSFDESILSDDAEKSFDISVPEKMDNTNEIEELRVGAESISMELLATPEGLKRGIVQVSTSLRNISGFITSKFNKEAVAQNIFKGDTIKKIGKAENYLQYSKIRVYKSVGQSCKTIELVNVMDESFKTTIMPFIKLDLPRIEKLFANLATNIEEMKSVRNADIITPAFYAKYQANLAMIGNKFNAKDTSATDTFGNLFERFADYEASCSIVAEINDEIYKLNIDKVVGSVDRMDASVQTIIANLNSGYDVSPVVIKSLSESTYQLATLLEFYSLFLYKLREITVSLKDTGKVLK